MTGTSAEDAPPPAARSTAARRRSAGIYGTIVASAVLAAGGAHLRTVPLAVTVLVTLLVYWAAEGYAELLSERIYAGHLPTRVQLRASLVAIWPHDNSCSARPDTESGTAPLAGHGRVQMRWAWSVPGPVSPPGRRGHRMRSCRSHCRTLPL